MNHRWATIISYVLHPLLMCTYLIAGLAFWVPHAVMPIGINTSGTLILVTLVFITTFIIPVINLYVLKLSGKISSVTLTNRHERITPIFYTIAMYLVTAYLFFQKVELGVLIPVLLSLTAALMVLALLITFVWKISLHAMATGAFIGVFLGLSSVRIYHFEYLLAFLFLLAGLVLSARLKLEAHTPRQVYVGFVLGIFSSFVAISYFQL